MLISSTGFVTIEEPLFKKWWRSIYEKFIEGKKSPFEVDLANHIHAHRVESQGSSNMIDDEAGVLYLLTTNIKIMERGRNTTKSITVYCGLRIEPDGNNPQISMIKISPNSETKEIGTVTSMTENSSHAGLDGYAKIGIDYDLPASIGINGSIRKSRDSEKIENVRYPKQIPKIEATWNSNEAKWEFARGEIEGWENVYWLNIYFRVQDVSKMTNSLYYIYPDIRIEDNQFRNTPRIPMTLDSR